MWKDPQFLADYARVIKTEPIFVSGPEGQEVLAELGKTPQQVKEYLSAFATKMTAN